MRCHKYDFDEFEIGFKVKPKLNLKCTNLYVYEVFSMLDGWATSIKPLWYLGAKYQILCSCKKHCIEIGRVDHLGIWVQSIEYFL